jgi:outer membrane biosynthesis protein TonB
MSPRAEVGYHSAMSRFTGAGLASAVATWIVVASSVWLGACRGGREPPGGQSARDGSATTASMAGPAPLPVPTDGATDPVEADLPSKDAVARTVAARPARKRREPAPVQPRASTGPEAHEDGPARITSLETSGGVPRSVAAEVIRRGTASLQACRPESTAGSRPARGRVLIKLTINMRGIVELAEVLKSSLQGSDATELCLVEAARRFKFPHAAETVGATATFQLEL